MSGVAATLAALDATCKHLRLPFFLVGALARDLLLHHLRGVDPSPRLTRDVDVAIAVESWEDFEQLREHLIRQHNFQSTRTAHRLMAPASLLVDLIPFGAVENEQQRVRWPPDFQFEMSVLGYHEALERTEVVLIDGVELRVIPLRAFGPLKLLAWADRRHQTPRDAEDFCFVLTNFWNAETALILNRHADLFEAEGGDNDFIGARSYGREAASFISRAQPLTETLLSLLERETTDIHNSPLTVAMGTACSDAYERRFELLRRCHLGLAETLTPP